MALETLSGLKTIGGYEVTRGVSNFSKDCPVFIHDETNEIAFKIQNGPIKENGVNGCQLDTLIETSKIMIERLNEKFPCRENSMAITKLDEALQWLNQRNVNREKRGVEGLSKL